MWGQKEECEVRRSLHTHTTKVTKRRLKIRIRGRRLYLRLTEELLYSLFFSTKPSWRLSRLFQCVQEQGAEERFEGRETEKGRSVGDWVAVAQSEERAREGSEATTVKRLEGGGVTERGERKAEGEEGARVGRLN
jgi:hypothetical protein